MANPPRIWLDYRPVRIGWVVTQPSIELLTRAASFNTCLWGGRHNCIIPVHDEALADSLVSCFGVDILIAIEPGEAATAYINRFPHLHHHAWRDTIFNQRRCEFADIRHAVRRMVAHRGRDAEIRMAIPTWQDDDSLGSMLALQFGRYPVLDANIANYKAGVESAFSVTPTSIGAAAEIPITLLEMISPLGLTGYDMTRDRQPGWRDGPGVVLGSCADFDALLMFWNLRAAGLQLIFYDQTYSERLRPFANTFLARLREPRIGGQPHVTFWIRSDRPRDDSWRPDLDLNGLSLVLDDGRGDTIWNGLNIRPSSPQFSAWRRDVVPSYAEADGKASASFALPDRPFNDDDTQTLSQKFAVVIDASQFGEPDAELTFETPFVPRLNEFYGRNFYHDYDSARAQEGHFGKGSIAVITSISTQRLEISAFRVFAWMKSFFALCGMSIERSEPGLRCSRLIAQLGGLQSCRVLKIRGVRALLRAYGVDQYFTRAGAMEEIRDVDPATGTAGFDGYRNLFIEYRESGDLTPDAVLRYLLERRVFRVGLEFKCPNCELPSWMHLDDVKTRSTCSYCDHTYDVSPQLRDRDWRYRRSGIFGRDDDQLGGVPVALTLQQLGASMHDKLIMYSTATKFEPAGTRIEPCEADFIVVAASSRQSESDLQILFGETKSEGSFDAQDVRKLAALADAVPRDLAEAFIMFSKTGTFTPEETTLAGALNGPHRLRVILWSRDELEPFYPYERSRGRLGDHWMASTFEDMARVTHMLYFAALTPAPAA